MGFLLRCGDEGTGVGEEMASATTSLHANSVLGRVSLGKRLTHAMIILSTLFALLVANLTLIMVVQARDVYKRQVMDSAATCAVVSSPAPNHEPTAT